jgi:hypothetical protein
MVCQSKEVWFTFYFTALSLLPVRPLQLLLPNSVDPCLIVESFKLQLGLPFFMEIIVTMSWSIWMVRNDVIFKGIPHSVHCCKQIFKNGFALVMLRAKVAYHPRIDLWLQAFV